MVFGRPNSYHGYIGIEPVIPSEKGIPSMFF